MPKILIVDDDPAITELIKSVFGLEGYESIIVNDSTLAMETAHLVNPDLITLDVMMPKLSGLDLCFQLHQDPKFANIPVIFISAKLDLESKRKALEAGAKAFIAKPFRIDELLNTTKSLLP